MQGKTSLDGLYSDLQPSSIYSALFVPSTQSPPFRPWQVSEGPRSNQDTESSVLPLGSASGAAGAQAQEKQGWMMSSRPQDWQGLSVMSSHRDGSAEIP